MNGRCCVAVIAILAAGGALVSGLGSCSRLPARDRLHASEVAPSASVAKPVEPRPHAKAEPNATVPNPTAPPTAERGFGEVRWSAHGNAVALVRGAQTLERVELWNAREWAQVGEADMSSVAAIPGGDRFLIERSRRGGSASPRDWSVWEGTSGERLFSLGVDAAEQVVEGPVCVSASGQHAVSSGRVWALANGQIVARGDKFFCQECLSCALSPDGRFFSVVAQAHVHGGSQQESVRGRLTVYAVPSGQRVAESMLPAQGWIYWPAAGTVIMETEVGVLAGSPFGGIRPLGAGLTRAVFSADGRRLAVVPVQGPGIAVYALPGLGLLGRRTRGLFALASPTLHHWLWNHPDDQSETYGVVESITGAAPTPVTEVHGWLGDGRAVVVSDPAGLRALPLERAPPGVPPRLARLSGGEAIARWFPRPNSPEGLIALASGKLLVWKADGSLVALPSTPGCYTEP